MSTALSDADDWQVTPTERRAGAKAQRLESPGAFEPRVVQSSG